MVREQLGVDMSQGRDGWVGRFDVTVPIMMAVVTIVSALIAWQATIDADNAGNADFAGLGAAVNRQDARVVDSTTTYQQHRAYTAYVRNVEVGDAVNADLQDPEKTYRGRQLAAMQAERSARWNQTIVDKDFFDTRYLGADGTYDTRRQLGELAAEAAQLKDVEPKPHFATADEMRHDSKATVAMLIVMAFALLLYTLASELRHRIRYLLAVLGTMCLAFGVAGALIIQGMS
jgi:hypothetical protein